MTRHMLVLGKTGMGKSTLLETLFLAQVERGMGAALLDPHGDLAERAIAGIPRFRRNDLIAFRPGTPGDRVTVNLLAHRDPSERPLVAANALAVFRKVFAESWGPRTEWVLRGAIQTLLEVPRSTLLGINRLLTEERFREMALRHVRDEMVRRFWEIEFAAYPPAMRVEVVSPVLNKVGGLLGHPVVRAVVDSPKHGLSMRKVMDEGRVLVADLAKGRIGEDASAFLGAVLLARIQLDAYGRASVPPDARRIFAVHVDEIASFATESLTGFLAEARKYGVGLVAATQQLDQLPPALRSAALGNVGSLVVFRVGPEDAEALEPEFAPELRAEDLLRLPRHEFAVKLCVDGVAGEGFGASTSRRLVEPNERGCR
ncbi:MAG: DUF87 domain-containing protein [Sandaracinaceae bacterium]|nr:DUF87 domain-containing protein [Sandaracinaceae bacterium]